MNNPQNYFDKTEVQNFRVLCEKFGGHTFQSPYRSTVPLLSLVQHSRKEWTSLLKSWGTPSEATVHFEYCVDSPKKGGNPSQTDVMLVSKSKVQAIEAKWTEKRYETVAKRISSPEKDGADPQATVEGWIKHLHSFSAESLQLEDFSDVVYQMLHRAASACAVAKATNCLPELIYLHFNPSPEKNSATLNEYVSDLTHLHNILGSPKDLIFRCVELPVFPTPAFEIIKNLNKHLPITSTQVFEALCHGPLFTFGQPTIRII